MKKEEKQITEKLESIANQKVIVADKKSDYNKFLASDEEISKLDNRKVKYEKELATMAKLEQDKKDLLKSIEDERNNIRDFFSKAKDKLDDNGMSQEDLDAIDDFNHLEEATNKFIDEIKQKIESLSNDIISKNEDIVIFKQNIKASQKPLKELADVENRCPVCQSEIDYKKKSQLIQNYEIEIADNEKLIAQNEEDVKLLSKNKKSLEEKLVVINDLSKEIIEYKQKVNHLEGEVSKLNKLDEGLESK